MSPKKRNSVILLLVLVGYFYSPLVQPGQAECSQLSSDAQSGSIVVNAAPGQVFQAIKQSRYQEPDRRKVVSSDSNSAVLEEWFKGLPIIGDATCRYIETEKHNQRIDYKILSSDKFKAFDGAWELEPINEGRATKLKLSSYVEPNLKVPFAKQLAAHNTRRDIKRRLTNIKQSVECQRAENTQRTSAVESYKL